MAADSTLVQGAYRASKHYDMGLAEAKRRASDKISKIKPIKREPEVDNQHLVKADSKADSVAENPTMTKTEKVKLREELENKKLEYEEASKNKDTFKQETIMSDLDEDTGLLAKYTENRGLNAENWGNRSKKNGKTSQTGYGLRLANDKEAEKYLSGNITGEENQMKNPETGELGIKGPSGKWMSMDDQRKYIESFEVDNESFNQLDETVMNYKKIGTDSKPEDVFDTEGASKHIRSIVSKGNMKSLAYDEGPDGVSFYTNLSADDGLMVGLKFSDLGVEQVGDDDIIDKDELTREQREQIAKAFIESKDHEGDLEDMLVNYNLIRTERNYNNSRGLVMHERNVNKFNQSQGVKPLMSKPTLGNQPGVISGNWNAMPSTPAIGSGYQEGDVVI